MSYDTDERLKSYLDTNQLHREQMCLAILALDKRYMDVRPRHPRGGPDGGCDIQAVYKDGQLVFGAVGFTIQATDTTEHRRSTKSKFKKDLNRAWDENNKLGVFIFFTNVNLTRSEKDKLIDMARKKGLSDCEIYDRERLRIALDHPDGFYIRFEYLRIPLNESDQISFFTRWGDDIQSVISTGFIKLENKLNRIMFNQEINTPLENMDIVFELHDKFLAEDIGHFRLYCSMQLKEPKHNILSLLFGSTDDVYRDFDNDKKSSSNECLGIKNGIRTGMWEVYFDINDCKNFGWKSKGDNEYKLISDGSSIGMDYVESLVISYDRNGLFRYPPYLILNDLNEVFFAFLVNRSLAEKIKSIHFYAEGYMLSEITFDDFNIEDFGNKENFPIKFTVKELEDEWVLLRPKKSSAYSIDFSHYTPIKIIKPNKIIDSRAYKYHKIRNID